jgi:hypothetical protein
MPATNAELRDPIKAALRECRTLSAALAHIADSIRARTDDRDAQIDLGVIQKLGGNLESALGELDDLIRELLEDTPEALPIVEKALDFYRDPQNYKARRGTVPVIADGGTLAVAAASALRGNHRDGGGE